MEELNLVDWIHTSMYLDGSAITRQGVQRILKGDFLVDVTVEDHLSVGNYKKTIKMAYDMADMGIDLNERYIFKLYEAFAEPQLLSYRKNNPVLIAFDYNPPHPQEIEEQMDILIHWLRTDDCDNNPIRKAVYLHNKFIEIYPFEFYSEAMARILLNYELIQNDFPPVALNLSDQSYHRAIIDYLKKEDISLIYDIVERSLYNKLEMMLQITNE